MHLNTVFNICCEPIGGENLKAFSQIISKYMKNFTNYSNH